MHRRGSLAVHLGIGSKHRETIINTAIQTSKVARGTKRVCQACETRFYDLARERIVCPSCGAQYTPVAKPIVTLGARPASSTGKTGWRSKPQRLPKPPIPVGDQDEPSQEIVPDAADETPATVPEDDLVLEQEPDDADVADLIEHDVEEPKEG